MKSKPLIKKGQFVLFHNINGAKNNQIPGVLRANTLKLEGYFIFKGVIFKCTKLFPETSAGDFWIVEGKGVDQDKFSWNKKDGNIPIIVTEF